MKKFLLLIFSLPIYACQGGANNQAEDIIPFLLATAETLLITINNSQDEETLVNQQRREKVARKKANAIKHKELLRKQKSENTHRPKKISNGPVFKKSHR